MKPLRCPYCGAKIEADLQYTEWFGSDHRDLVGYDCDDWDCNAAWDPDGNPTRPSKKEQP